MTRHREFDAAEMSLSSYLISLDADAPFVAIPVFLSRSFRHNGIYVPAASQVTEPAGLAGMLADGELDALHTPRGPHGFGEGRVRRLFPDARAEEERYFAETGIFPVMHVVVLRRDVYEQRPWLAQSLYKAFEQARRGAAARIAETAALASLLPWGYAEAERTRSLMGADYW